MAMRYPRDLDRFRTFYSIASETGRTLVISPKTAHLLSTLHCDTSLSLPDPLHDPLIKIYNRQLLREDSWMQPFLSSSVTSDYVRSHQKSLLLELDFYYLSELIDIRPSSGACIHSMSEPFEEDPLSTVSDVVLDNWMTRFSMSRHQLHASGHAPRSEIFRMISEINAKRVFPVHTLHPEMFKGAERVEKGKRYEV